MRRVTTCPPNLLRLDTQGRVAVQRQLVPSQPDGDDDGFACGGQLEHKRNLIDLTAMVPTPAVTAAAAATSPPAAASCPTTFEAAWLRLVREGIPAIRQGFDDLGDLSARVEADPSLLADPSFRATFVGRADAIKATGQQILDFTLPPPVRHPALYGVSKLMARSVIFGMEDLVEALGHFDAGRGRKALAVLQQVGFQIDNAVFNMDAVAEGLDGFCE